MKIKSQEHFPATSQYEGECVECCQMVFRRTLFKCIWCGERACYHCAKRLASGAAIYLCDKQECRDLDAVAEHH